MSISSVVKDRAGARVVLIRGAPGLGKTTLAEVLRLGMTDGAIIDVDVVRNMICGERFIYNENFHYMNAVITAADLAQRLYELNHEPIIIVDVFAAEALRTFLNRIQGVRTLTISLYTDDSILVGRMKDRHNGFVNADAARAVNRHIYDTKAMGDIWLDVGILSCYEIRDRLLELMRVACFVDPPPVV